MKTKLRVMLAGVLMAAALGCSVLPDHLLAPADPGAPGAFCRTPSDCLSKNCAITPNSDPPTGTCT